MTYAHGSGASLGTHSPPKLAAELFPLIDEMFPAITEISRPASAPTSSRAAGPRGLLSSPARASRDPCRRPAPPARVTRAPSVGVRTQHFLELLELLSCTTDRQLAWLDKSASKLTLMKFRIRRLKKIHSYNFQLLLSTKVPFCPVSFWSQLVYGRDEVECHFYLFPKNGVATLQSRPPVWSKRAKKNYV